MIDKWAFLVTTKINSSSLSICLFEILIFCRGTNYQGAVIQYLLCVAKSEGMTKLEEVKL